jgi:uncharacterized membrane protein YphA (DoxX/SURF4 family)
MNIVLWALQVLLGLAFAAAGTMKVSRDRAQLQGQMPYVEDLSDGQVKAIGALEIAGALGLVLPAATGIAPLLTPAAALGLAVIMVGAALLHRRRREPQGIVVNAVLFAVAVVIAWGRFGPYAA